MRVRGQAGRRCRAAASAHEPAGIAQCIAVDLHGAKHVARFHRDRDQWVLGDDGLALLEGARREQALFCRGDALGDGIRLGKRCVVRGGGMLRYAGQSALVRRLRRGGHGRGR